MATPPGQFLALQSIYVLRDNFGIRFDDDGDVDQIIHFVPNSRVKISEAVFFQLGSRTFLTTQNRFVIIGSHLLLLALVHQGLRVFPVIS